MRKVSLVAMFIAMSVAIISCEENNSDIENAETTNEVSESTEETPETEKQEENSTNEENSNGENPEEESNEENNNDGEETNEKTIEEELNEALDSITFDDIVALEKELPSSTPTGLQFVSIRDLSKAFGSYTITKKTTTSSEAEITNFDPDELLIPTTGTQGSSFNTADSITISADTIEFLGNSTSSGSASLDQIRNEIVFNATVNGSTAARLVFRISSDNNFIDVVNATEKVSYRFERK